MIYLPKTIYAIAPAIYGLIGIVGIFFVGGLAGTTLGAVLVVITGWIVKMRMESRVTGSIITGKRK